MLEGGISFRNYNNVFLVNSVCSVGEMTEIYHTLEEQYNLFVKMANDTSYETERMIESNTFKLLRSSNKHCTDVLVEFAEKKNAINKKRREQYDKAFKEKIDFWGFLKDVSGDLYEFTDTKQVEISTTAGTFSIGGQ